MEHKISKKNSDYNRAKFSKKTLYTSRKKQKIEGGKPLMPHHYTYFIVAHGSFQTKLNPIKIPYNSSIITLNELNKTGKSTEVLEIINFYVMNNRLFKNLDTSKKKTIEGNEFIEIVQQEQIAKKQYIHLLERHRAFLDGQHSFRPFTDTMPTYFTSVRNHIYGTDGHMNDSYITFLPQKEDENQYLGVVRLNNDTGKIVYMKKTTKNYV